MSPNYQTASAVVFRVWPQKMNVLRLMVAYGLIMTVVLVLAVKCRNNVLINPDGMQPPIHTILILAYLYQVIVQVICVSTFIVTLVFAVNRHWTV